MITQAHSAMSEFNVEPPGAYFPHNEMWEGIKQAQYVPTRGISLLMMQQNKGWVW